MLSSGSLHFSDRFGGQNMQPTEDRKRSNGRTASGEEEEVEVSPYEMEEEYQPSGGIIRQRSE
jgi:hypothetical protein